MSRKGVVKYAVVEHYPDGNSSWTKLFQTEQQAQEYADNENRWLLDDDDLPLTVERVQTITIKYQGEQL